MLGALCYCREQGRGNTYFAECRAHTHSLPAPFPPARNYVYVMWVHYPTSGELCGETVPLRYTTDGTKPPSRARKTSMFICVPMVTTAVTLHGPPTPHGCQHSMVVNVSMSPTCNGCVRPLVAHAARYPNGPRLDTMHFHTVLSRFHGRQTVQGGGFFSTWLLAFHGCKRPILSSVIRS